MFGGPLEGDLNDSKRLSFEGKKGHDREVPSILRYHRILVQNERIIPVTAEPVADEDIPGDLRDFYEEDEDEVEAKVEASLANMMHEFIVIDCPTPPVWTQGLYNGVETSGNGLLCGARALRTSLIDAGAAVGDEYSVCTKLEVLQDALAFKALQAQNPATSNFFCADQLAVVALEFGFNLAIANEDQTAGQLRIHWATPISDPSLPTIYVHYRNLHWSGMERNESTSESATDRVSDHDSVEDLIVTVQPASRDATRDPTVHVTTNDEFAELTDFLGEVD